MRTPRNLARLCLATLSLALPCSAQVGAFDVGFDAEVFGDGFSGSVLIAFDVPDGQAEPRQTMHRWFETQPVLRFEVDGVKPNARMRLRPADAFATAPWDWSEMEAGTWRVQAVARRSPTGRKAGLSPGDVYSSIATVEFDPTGGEAVALELDRVVAQTPFPESERVVLFEHRSEALSAFHGFDYTLRAGVLLPSDYGERDSYPVVYSVTGFGGTHASIQRFVQSVTPGSPLDRAIIVVPDASNLYGHSVFCDSPSIGPWGEALVHELIPALEAEFGGAGAEHRYVTGVSSGGWSSLWLQVTYPDEFAGCWSHVPDPIDFHDFQQIDLYEPLADGTPRNMYVDENGAPRPVARRGDVVQGLYEDFAKREHVLNPGGQIRSFDGTFSPPGPDGVPQRLFDIETGVIDHALAATWRKYDISHRLLNDWGALRGKLAGKIHIYAGDLDNFYLEGAVERFRALASEAGMLDEMVVEVIPNMEHSLHAAGHQDMQATLLGRLEAAGL